MAGSPAARPDAGSPAEVPGPLKIEAELPSRELKIPQTLTVKLTVTNPLDEDLTIIGGGCGLEGGFFTDGEVIRPIPERCRSNLYKGTSTVGAKSSFTRTVEFEVSGTAKEGPATFRIGLKSERDSGRAVNWSEPLTARISKPVPVPLSVEVKPAELKVPLGSTEDFEATLTNASGETITFELNRDWPKWYVDTGKARPFPKNPEYPPVSVTLKPGESRVEPLELTVWDEKRSEMSGRIGLAFAGISEPVWSNPVTIHVLPRDPEDLEVKVVPNVEKVVRGKPFPVRIRVKNKAAYGMKLQRFGENLVFYASGDVVQVPKYSVGPDWVWYVLKPGATYEETAELVVREPISREAVEAVVSVRPEGFAKGIDSDKVLIPAQRDGTSEMHDTGKTQS